MDPLNLSEAEFEAAMTAIDEDLRKRSNQVVGREVLGFFEYSQRYKVAIVNKHPVAIRIFDWFSRLYGDRLRMDWDFGRTVVLVKGDICRMRIIRFFGVLPLVCSPPLMEIKLTQEISPGRHVEISNLALNEWVEGLTHAMAERLSREESDAILEAYARAFPALASLEDALGKREGGADAPYIAEARHDLIGSVESLLTSPPNYGQSKWSSLQAVEKVLKSCIRKKGTIPKKSHDLRSLSATAAAVGVPPLDPALIDKIVCAADVRYDSSLVSKDEAVAAHYGALEVCGRVAPILKERRGHSGCDWDELRMSSTFSTKRLVLHHVAGPPKSPA
jgi:hypothetical protein